MRMTSIRNFVKIPIPQIKQIDGSNLQDFVLSFPEISKEYQLDRFLNKINRFNYLLEDQHYELLDHVGRNLEFEIENHFYWQEFVSICEIIRYNLKIIPQMVKEHEIIKAMQFEAERIKQMQIWESWERKVSGGDIYLLTVIIIIIFYLIGSIIF